MMILYHFGCSFFLSVYFEGGCLFFLIATYNILSQRRFFPALRFFPPSWALHLHASFVAGGPVFQVVGFDS